MKLMLIYNLMKVAYAQILRDLLLKAIDDPDSEWDDIVLSITDSIFNYEV